MTIFTLSELYVYPIKSAAGIALSEAQMTVHGLQYDRRWMVVDAQGKFITQRRFPRMALISVRIGEQLEINAPGMAELSVPLVSEPGEFVKVEVWGDACEAIALPHTKAWFSQFLDIPCQLVYMPDSSNRPTAHGKLGEDKLVSFADAYPYLLISEASLSELNQRLTEKGGETVTMSRFRPNLVIGGVETAHEEDSWTQIKIGEVIFDLPKLCDRCSIPNVNPKTGDRGKEPTRTLATYRAWDRGIWFGQNAIAQLDSSEQTLRVGDTLEVLARKDSGRSPRD